MILYLLYLEKSIVRSSRTKTMVIVVVRIKVRIMTMNGL